LEVAVGTLMSHLHCYILALAAERVSRDTDIWLEPPTLANLFDAEREVRGRRRSPEETSTAALRGRSQRSRALRVCARWHAGGRVESARDRRAEMVLVASDGGCRSC